MKTFKEKQTLANKYRPALRKRATKAEKAFKKMLDDEGIKYTFQKAFLKDYFCIVDFYIAKPYRLCIEIDGPYHLKPEQRKKDIRRDDYLINKRKCRVVRLQNHHVLECAPWAVFRRINRAAGIELVKVNIPSVIF